MLGIELFAIYAVLFIIRKRLAILGMLILISANYFFFVVTDLHKNNSRR